MQNKEEKVEIPFPPDVMEKIVEYAKLIGKTPDETVEEILEEELRKPKYSKS